MRAELHPGPPQELAWRTAYGPVVRIQDAPSVQSAQEERVCGTPAVFGANLEPGVGSRERKSQEEAARRAGRDAGLLGHAEEVSGGQPALGEPGLPDEAGVAGERPADLVEGQLRGRGHQRFDGLAEVVPGVRRLDLHGERIGLGGTGLLENRRQCLRGRGEAALCGVPGGRAGPSQGDLVAAPGQRVRVAQRPAPEVQGTAVRRG